jgi:hypothetical protein
MLDRRILSAGGDCRSEGGLFLLPQRGEPAAEIGVFADSMAAIDAWGAAALKTSVEYYARYQQRQVTTSRPRRDDIWRLFYHLLSSDCPSHFVLTNDAEPPTGRMPASIILPAVRVGSVDAAEGIAEMLLSRNSGNLTRAVRFIAEELPELIDNALQHALNTPTSPVVCCFYDATEDELQLVVCDLGTGYDGAEASASGLVAAIDAQPRGGLSSAIGVATSRGLDATLTVAAGNGRVYWRAGTWTTAEAAAVPGFTVALAVQISSSR